ncbi:hypothetical protein K0M31_020273 [Melipona bicolor]|uniref:Uncharacterized protein n=1 Tax=Melipona bicolor TaxID=60889 RepID=A0AA40G1B2_9HYME|nr:hypothetical protein K0M31_020273 [Melipona bicolor]
MPGKKGLRDGKERILDVTAAAVSAAAENLPRRIFEGEARTQAPGGDAASGIDVINKSVNGVSGLMSVVTRWSGVDGAVEQRQPTSYSIDAIKSVIIPIDPLLFLLLMHRNKKSSEIIKCGEPVCLQDLQQPKRGHPLKIEAGRRGKSPIILGDDGRRGIFFQAEITPFSLSSTSNHSRHLEFQELGWTNQGTGGGGGAFGETTELERQKT